MKRLSLRWVLWGVAAFAFAGLLRGAAEADAAAPRSDVIELPVFLVTERPELPPVESWRYAEVPGFEILSQISQSRTKRFVRDFQQLQQVIDAIWPAAAGGGTGVPATIILCGGGRQFDSFTPVGQEDDADRVTSHFIEDAERRAIVVDFVGERFTGLRQGGTAAGAASPAGADEASDVSAAEGESRFMSVNDPYREFYLQYFRHLIRRAVGKSQPWLEEGLVQLMASIDFSKKRVTIGKLGEGYAGGAGRNFNVALAKQALMNFDDLFASERPSLREEPAYPMQCYAFVHLCLYGMGKQYQKPFVEFVRRTSGVPASEVIFKECFGKTYKQMEMLLRSYIDFTAYENVEFRAKKGSEGFPEPPPFELREATQAEIGRIKGEAYRLGGHPDLARITLLAPYLRGEKDPRLLAALGLHERSVGRDDRARKFLEAAAAAKVERPRAYLELARLRFAAAKAKPGGADGKLDAGQLRTVLDPLLVACTQPPPMGEVYESIAAAWLASEPTPTKDELSQLYGGAQRFPTRLKLVYLAATLAVRHGDTQNARALVEHGLHHAPNPQTKLRFQDLKATLPLLEAEPVGDKQRSAPTGSDKPSAKATARNGS